MRINVRLQTEIEKCTLKIFNFRFSICLLATLICIPCVALAQVNKSNPPAESEEPAGNEPIDEEDEKLPLLKDMALPSFQRLMQGPPFDWLVMHTGKVLVVEPVSPRPGTIDDINQRISRATRKAGDPPETEDAKRRRLDLYYLPVTLPEGEEREWRLHTRFLKEIIYYEDLMLRRIDQLLDDSKVRQAYELLLALEARQESWPGVVARKDRLLFTEAVVQSAEGRSQHALALLESLHERRASYPGLEAQFGVVGDTLISQAFDKAELRQARYFLRRIARKYANHRVVKDWTARLMQMTRDLVDKAVAAEREGRVDAALDLAESAARHWPELPELLPVYNRLAQRRQRLRVGVVELPEAAPLAAPVLLSNAERRHRQLTQTPLFEPSRFDNKVVRYESRFFSDWEPTELGHSVLFRLRPYRLPGESQPMLTAAGLVWTMGDRLSPKSTAYDARFAATVESLEVRSPFELAVRFQQVPLRPEALFEFPYAPALSAEFRESPELPAGGEVAAHPAVTYPFQLQVAGADRAVYRRTIPDAEFTADHRISEVIEMKYDSHAKVIQGLLRGEVSLLPRVPAYSVRGLAARQEFFSQVYALPTTHALQFNPHNKALATRTLRRALVYALNRPQILEQVFLHEEPGALGRVTSAPFATTSYAYSRDGARKVEPHKFDRALAYSLAKTTEKEMGGSKLPVLRLVCGPEPEVQTAAGRIIEHWKAAGIEAQLRVAPAVDFAPDGHTPDASTPSDRSDWDIVYRTDALAEPLVELWPYLALTNSTATSALGHLPMWLRKQLLELDRVGDLSSATEQLHLFHELFWAEVHLIPLWELDDVLVYRKHVRGVLERPVSTYQKIERWKVDPWFSRESP
jgi:ABC-type transport system substrate-binding protein